MEKSSIDNESATDSSELNDQAAAELNHLIQEVRACLHQHGPDIAFREAARFARSVQ